MIRGLLNKVSRFVTKYPKKHQPSMDSISENKKAIGEAINCVQSELKTMQNDILIRKKMKLQEENSRLFRQIEAAKAQLIALEVTNGKKQIPLPGEEAKENHPTPADASTGKVENAKPITKEKDKKPQKDKARNFSSSTQSKPTPIDVPVDVGRLDMRVGKILEVARHPDADSLYVEKIDVGESAPRTVVSGLVKFVPIEKMANRMVVVLCNLKPAKMRGVTSEAMVMCASTPNKVEILSPPDGAVSGDLIHCEGYTRQPDDQLNPKKKIFETCAPDLSTNDQLVACYKGNPLIVPGKGKVVAQTLSNVQIK